MHKLVTLLLSISFIATIFLFYRELAIGVEERDSLNLEVKNLEGKIVELRKIITAANSKNGSERLKVINENQHAQEGNENALVTDYLDFSDSGEAKKPKEFIDMSSVSARFLSEQTDYKWAIPYEDNISNLFYRSERLSDLGFVSSECRTSTCKVLFTRSIKGALSDSQAFISEFSKESWGKYKGFSFEFGKEGQEDFVTLWITL